MLGWSVYRYNSHTVHIMTIHNTHYIRRMADPRPLIFAYRFVESFHVSCSTIYSSAFELFFEHRRHSKKNNECKQMKKINDGGQYAYFVALHTHIQYLSTIFFMLLGLNRKKFSILLNFWTCGNVKNRQKVSRLMIAFNQHMFDKRWYLNEVALHLLLG